MNDAWEVDKTNVDRVGRVNVETERFAGHLALIGANGCLNLAKVVETAASQLRKVAVGGLAWWKAVKRQHERALGYHAGALGQERVADNHLQHRRLARRLHAQHHNLREAVSTVVADVCQRVLNA